MIGKNNLESTVSIELSSAELRWLAGAFGMASLPISLPTASPEALNQAKITLQERGIIQPGQTRSWQFSSFAGLTLQWMAGARKYWVFEQFRPDGLSFECSLFLLDGIALIILPAKGGKRLLACKDINDAISIWKAEAGLPIPDSNTLLPGWDVLQPLTVILSKWKHPQVAESMAPSDFLTWASSPDWAGEWSLVIGDKRFSRMVLAVQGGSVWAGCFSPGKPGEFPLEHYDQGRFRGILSNM